MKIKGREKFNIGFVNEIDAERKYLKVRIPDSEEDVEYSYEAFGRNCFLIPEVQEKAVVEQCSHCDCDCEDCKKIEREQE